MHAATFLAGSNIYLCPITGSPLRVDTAKAIALKGANEYPVRDGCIMFFDRPRVQNDAEIAKVRRALELSREVGWRHAIDEAYVPGSYTHQYITDSERASFLDLLPLNKSSIVLEIGCSMGQHTQEIAARCAMVCGLDVIPEQALFAKQRCAQLGLNNVSTACGGEEARLPYNSCYFDVVVLNLVFEWCGSRSKDPHETVQRRMLSEIARVLKPGGTLFLQTKNRFAISLLLGRPDEHANGVRFGSALPRWALHAFLRLRGIKKTRGWLHSYDALRKMVYSAGFGTVNSYWAAPEMRYPQRFIPTDSSSIRTARRKLGPDIARGRLRRACLAAIPAPWVKHVTPGLCIVATK